jgi:hypothetical protein
VPDDELFDAMFRRREEDNVGAWHAALQRAKDQEERYRKEYLRDPAKNDKPDDGEGS